MVSQIWLVGIGGFIGAMARYLVKNKVSGSSLFPIGTLLVNITGSFFMGLLAGSKWISLPVSFLLGTGFLGAYTTFSTFQLELFQLNKSRQYLLFFLYLISSYLFGLLSAGFGFWIIKNWGTL